MFALSSSSTEQQIDGSKQLGELLQERVQKLQELLEIDRKIERIACGIKSLMEHATNVIPTQSVVLAEKPQISHTKALDDNQADTTTTSSSAVSSKILSHYGRSDGLPYMIAKFLHGKSKGESKASIVAYCLRSGYESDSVSFERLITQVLYNMKRKGNIRKDQHTRMWILV